MRINFNNPPSYIRKEIETPKKTIARGARNQTVKRIQEWLCYHKCRTAVDGDFGPATESCVKDFQKLKRKTQTGKVDADIWRLLVKPMADALVTPAGLKNKRPDEAMLAIATRHVGQHPVEVGGANSGPWVRLYCSGNDGPPWAWCAGFVSFIMHQAYFAIGKKAPLKGSVSCDSLAAQAKEAGLFVEEKELSSGRLKWEELGDACIFLRRRTSTDWTHTGFALEGFGSKSQIAFSTIEGNTNDEGAREGFEACRRKRSIASSNYDFIRFNQ